MPVDEWRIGLFFGTPYPGKLLQVMKRMKKRTPLFHPHESGPIIFEFSFPAVQFKKRPHLIFQGCSSVFVA